MKQLGLVFCALVFAGLVFAAWHCSEGSGTSLTDYSGNGFTMDLGGMSWVEDSPR